MASLFSSALKSIQDTAPKTRQLLSAGCSFTRGDELSDWYPDMGFSQRTWAARLAHKLSYDRYFSIAQSGASNQKIARLLIEHLHVNPRPDAVAVMWTMNSRFEYHDPKLDRFIELNIHLKSRNAGVRTYYDLCGHSHIHEKQMTLHSLLLAQTALERLQIPYVFVMADDAFINGKDTSDNVTIESLIAMVDWSRWFHVPTGFSRWASERYPIGPNYHPLDEAHEQLADDMLPLARELLSAI